MPLYTEHLNLAKPTGDERYNIAVPNGNMDIIDENARRLEAEVAALRGQGGGVSYANQHIHLHVSKNGSDSGDGSEEKPFLTIGKAVLAAKKYPGAASMLIDVEPGVYDEEVSIQEFSTPICLRGHSANTQVEIKSVTVYMCVNFQMHYISISQTEDGGHLLHISDTPFSVEYCVLNGNGTHHGFVIRACNGYFGNSEIHNTQQAVQVINTSVVLMVSISGSGHAVGISNQGSICMVEDVHLDADTAERAIWGGQIFKS